MARSPRNKKKNRPRPRPRTGAVSEVGASTQSDHQGILALSTSTSTSSTLGVKHNANAEIIDFTEIGTDTDTDTEDPPIIAKAEDQDPRQDILETPPHTPGPEQKKREKKRQRKTPIVLIPLSSPSNSTDRRAQGPSTHAPKVMPPTLSSSVITSHNYQDRPDIKSKTSANKIANTNGVPAAQVQISTRSTSTTNTTSYASLLRTSIGEQHPRAALPISPFSGGPRPLRSPAKISSTSATMSTGGPAPKAKASLNSPSLAPPMTMKSNTGIEFEAECVICSEELASILSKAESQGKGGIGGGLGLYSCELAGCGVLYCIECAIACIDRSESTLKSKTNGEKPTCPACTREWDTKIIREQAEACDPIKFKTSDVKTSQIPMPNASAIVNTGTSATRVTNYPQNLRIPSLSAQVNDVFGMVAQPPMGFGFPYTASSGTLPSGGFGTTLRRSDAALAPVHTGFAPRVLRLNLAGGQTVDINNNGLAMNPNENRMMGL